MTVLARKPCHWALHLPPPRLHPQIDFTRILTIIRSMPHAKNLELGFAPEVVDHLAAIERKHHQLIQKTLDERLSHTPDAETRNRKPVEQPAPFEATWELRFGPGNRFRVYYEVDPVEHFVWILAIGIKELERLLMGGKEFKL